MSTRALLYVAVASAFGAFVWLLLEGHEVAAVLLYAALIAVLGTLAAMAGRSR